MKVAVPLCPLFAFVVRENIKKKQTPEQNPTWIQFSDLAFKVAKLNMDQPNT